MNQPPEGTVFVAPKWRDLGVRTLSAAVLIPIVVLDVWVGGAWFDLMVALLAVMMAHEWTNMAHERRSSQFAVHATSGLCGVALPLGAGLMPALIAIAVLTAAAVLIDKQRDGPFSQWTFAGVPYIGLAAGALILLRHDSAAGVAAIIWLFAVVWAADTLAFFGGRVIGGPKLAPAISPNKTWAGLFGALAGGLLAGAAAGWCLGYQSLSVLAGIGAVLALIEQGGDLFESALKRHFGTKDSGRLIPGHGGILDRVDGLVAAAIAAAAIGIVHSGSQSAGAGLLVW
ncbi:phosphatidate cytidylyltransferase [soil metagenome]